MLTGRDDFLCEMVKRGYTPAFFSQIGGRENTSARGTCVSSTCLKFNSDRLARPHSSLKRTHTPFVLRFVSRSLMGLDGTVAQRGEQEALLLTTNGGGGYAPAVLRKFIQYL